MLGPLDGCMDAVIVTCVFIFVPILLCQGRRHRSCELFIFSGSYNLSASSTPSDLRVEWRALMKTSHLRQNISKSLTLCVLSSCVPPY